jgi:uncharacterized protein DUF6221
VSGGLGYAATAELVAWLNAQLDDDERVARAATPGPWQWVELGGRVKLALVADGRPWQMVLPSATPDVYPQVADAAHIARHDPTRVLADIAAKRAILPYLADRVLRHLATAYADRPGYQPEWAPPKEEQ